MHCIFIVDIAPVPIKKEDVTFIEKNFSKMLYWPWEIPTARWKEVLNVCSKLYTSAIFIIISCQ